MSTIEKRKPSESTWGSVYFPWTLPSVRGPEIEPPTFEILDLPHETSCGSMRFGLFHTEYHHTYPLQIEHTMSAQTVEKRWFNGQIRPVSPPDIPFACCVFRTGKAKAIVAVC